MSKDIIDSLIAHMETVHSGAYNTMKMATDEIKSLRQQLAAAQDKQWELIAEKSPALVEARQQLAAALAACKLKDAALENVEGMLDELRDYPVTHNEIIEALAIQPDDSTKFLS